MAFSSPIEICIEMLKRHFLRSKSGLGVLMLLRSTLSDGSDGANHNSQFLAVLVAPTEREQR